MHAVRKGDLSVEVPVESNDELGVLAESFNHMTEGLLERERMKTSLLLAMEVQQNLLPKKTPQLEGLEMAGKCIYCDETGGDYYDYFMIEDQKKNKVCVVIGDVSGHGISAALLMASARSFIRQRSSLPGNIADIITDANRQLVADIEESGQFITLFYLVIEKETGSLNWVRAGHEPAIFYDPKSDSFELLRGEGIALALDENWEYIENKKCGLVPGQMVVLGTDGIWEAKNTKGELFGKDALYDVIRRNATAGPIEIIHEIFHSVREFQEHNTLEDDMTLVVIKINKDFKFSLSG
jgi:sigma-B regulation protein RsbU (phosphoserine phosphatase)